MFMFIWNRRKNTPPPPSSYRAASTVPSCGDGDEPTNERRNDDDGLHQLSMALTPFPGDLKPPALWLHVGLVLFLFSYLCVHNMVTVEVILDGKLRRSTTGRTGVLSYEQCCFER